LRKFDLEEEGENGKLLAEMTGVDGVVGSFDASFIKA
jgi:hypothetical protein